jgi:hypothetical protein
MNKRQRKKQFFTRIEWHMWLDCGYHAFVRCFYCDAKLSDTDFMRGNGRGIKKCAISGPLF